MVYREDLLSCRAVQENIKKARRSFFMFGSIGVYQGDLSPLSARSVVEVCVMPVLIYGSENWILNVTTIALLESFLAEGGGKENSKTSKVGIEQCSECDDGLVYYEGKDLG